MVSKGLFSFDRIAEFAIPELDPANMPDQVAILEQARRRESLFADPNKATLDWQSRAAEYFYDEGSYGESDHYSNRLGIAAKEAGDDRYLAKAYLWQCLCTVSYRSPHRLEKRIEQLVLLAKRSDDPFIRATRLFVQSLAFEKCFSWEAPKRFAEDDDWCNVFLSYKEAAQIFLSEGEVDLAILCHVEYALAKLSHGEYLTSISWIEEALRLAKENGCWKWTGRMLQVAGSAATDQGYRRHVEKTLRKAVAWCEYVGDEWGRIEGITAVGRLLMFEIPAMDAKAAAKPDDYLVKAMEAADLAGMPWLRSRADHARQFLRRKSGIETDNADKIVNVEGDRLAAKLELDVRKRRISRLEDGINDSSEAFFIFNALRNEVSGCEDFLNEYRNSAAARIVGAGSFHVVLFSEVVENPYLRGLTDALFNATERRETFDDIAEVVEGEDRIWIQRRVSPSGDGAIVKLRDVSAERRIEDALRSAADSAMLSERTRTEFLANMSHEIRTPISGVLGLARMLAETQLDVEQRAYVQDIIGSGDILLGLIGDILDLSKLEAGYIEIASEPVVLRDLVEGIVGLYHGQAAEQKLKIECQVAEELPKDVLADGVRLRQILANLVANAVKFTPAGSIRLRASVKEQEIHFEVSDTGIGIPEDRLGTIFDRFQQIPGSPAVPRGSGLGLTITKRLVELMGGSIDVRSKVGEGSVFTVRIPLTLTSEPTRAEEDELPDRFEGMQVLIVEDNAVNLIVSRHVLRKFGCEVQSAGNGREAVDALAQKTFDVVFMDVRMPILDGLSATREIRGKEEMTGKRVPIVALTAGAIAEERDQCFEAGMDDYVSKPFTAEALRAILAKWRHS